ncbi:MAG: hypothetical protein K6E98_05460 [Lachnospiraceae bacterium]|nr:hypothetical protein [Lachnospiraceae bacterium]
MFTKKELIQFKEYKHNCPWINECLINPELIILSDTLFNMEWRLFKYTIEEKDYYVIKRTPIDIEEYVESYTEESLENVLITLENTLWNKTASLKPDLSDISLEYILSTPKRLGIQGLSTIFLSRLLPIKLNY